MVFVMTPIFNLRGSKPCQANHQSNISGVTPASKCVGEHCCTILNEHNRFAVHLTLVEKLVKIRCAMGLSRIQRRFGFFEISAGGAAISNKKYL